VQKVF